MSVRLFSQIMKQHSPSNHVDFSVLLNLASHANDAGGECWPSMKTIAAEMRLGERSVARSLVALKKDGWIIVTRHSRDHKGSSYQLVLSKLFSVAPEVSETGEDDEKAQSHAWQASENDKVTCLSVQSHLPVKTESPACDANPSYELSLTVLKEERSCAQAPRRLFPPSPKNGLGGGDTPSHFADGHPFDYLFAFAAEYVPEIFASAPTEEDRAYFATLTAEEFDEYLFKARYEFDYVESDVPYAEPRTVAHVNVFEPAQPVTAVQVQLQLINQDEERRDGTRPAQPTQKVQTKTGRRRGLNASEAARLRDDANTR
jgi:hypothetical protein